MLETSKTELRPISSKIHTKFILHLFLSRFLSFGFGSLRFLYFFSSLGQKAFLLRGKQTRPACSYTPYLPAVPHKRCGCEMGSVQLRQRLLDSQKKATNKKHFERQRSKAISSSVLLRTTANTQRSKVPTMCSLCASAPSSFHNHGGFTICMN